MPMTWNLGRLAATVGIVLLTSSCSLLKPDARQPERPPAPATPASAWLADKAPVCSKEGESCSGSNAKCCAGYVCAGIVNSFCMPQF